MAKRKRLKPLTWTILGASGILSLFALWVAFPIPVVMMSVRMTGAPSPMIETIYAPLDKAYLEGGAYYNWITIQRSWYDDDDEATFIDDSPFF